MPIGWKWTPWRRVICWSSGPRRVMVAGPTRGGPGMGEGGEERAAQGDGGGADEARAGNGEGLEVAAVLAARRQAGFLELARDVVGGLIDAAGSGTAALALVGGKKGDVARHPLLGEF